MVATSIPVAVVRALVTVLLVSQTFLFADACAYAMPDCSRPCPVAGCVGVAPSVCDATATRVAQAPAGAGVVMPAIYAVPLAVVPIEPMLEPRESRARWRLPATATLPVYIVFGRLRN